MVQIASMPAFFICLDGAIAPKAQVHKLERLIPQVP
jgi:hypothetical protein